MRYVCSPRVTGTRPTSGIVPLSNYFGWHSVMDASQFGDPSNSSTTDATVRIQERFYVTIHDHEHVPLLFPLRRYLISKPIAITGACTLIGIEAESSSTYDPLASRCPRGRRRS